MAGNMGGGIASIISSLFNSEQFSDVSFVFDDDNGHSYYGHKLILSLRSRFFASKFYEKGKDDVTNHRIKLPSEMKSLIFTMLRFIYTDEIKFNSITDAERLLAIAEKFEVDELKSKCLSYLLNDPVTIQNIFSKYECALNKKIVSLLNSCQTFAVCNSELVFKSDDFNVTPMEVVEDIIKQENLSISSELVVIDAVLKWGKEKCKKDKSYVDDIMLKQYIQPLLKHVRFLTLTTEEFQSVLKRYPNFFNSYETHSLTCKILQPEKQGDVPEYISKSEIKRNALKCSGALYSKSFPVQSSVSESSGALISRNIIKENSSHDSSLQKSYLPYISNYVESAKLNEKKDGNSVKHVINFSNGSQSCDTLNILKETNQINLEFVADMQCFDVKKDLFYSDDKKMKSSDSKLNMKSNTLQQPLQNKDRLESPNTLELMNSLSPHNYSSDLNMFFNKSNVLPNNSLQIGRFQNDNIPQKSYRATESNTVKSNEKLVYEFKHPSVFTNQNDSSPKYSDRFSPPPPLYVSSSQFDTFDFLLSESTPSLQSSFRRDLRCDLIFRMIKGDIHLRNLELYIKNDTEADEIIEGDIEFKNFFSPDGSMSFKKKLIKNVLTIPFGKSVLLKEGNSAILTVSVDNLCISRCQIITNSVRELNSGSNFRCAISVKSNQRDPSGVPFVIKRLSYTPYKLY